jgi:hypothetical protein
MSSSSSSPQSASSSSSSEIAPESSSSSEIAPESSSSSEIAPESSSSSDSIVEPIPVQLVASSSSSSDDSIWIFADLVEQQQPDQIVFLSPLLEEFQLPDVPPPTSEIPKECCLCYDDSLPVLQDDNENWISITEYQAQIPDNVLILGPCRRHLTCKDCLVQILSSSNPHFLNPNRIRVPCLAAGQSCVSSSGAPFFYSDTEIEKLVPDAIYQSYLEEVERYSLPGFELVTCPACSSRVPLELELLQQQPIGRLVITCNQNRQCHHSFCYHCRTANVIIGLNTSYCQLCSGYEQGQHPKAFNHYFYKPTRRPSDKDPILWRNEELTMELVVAQLRELAVFQKNEFMEHGAASSNLHVLRCFNCLEGFIKTQDCNSMSHCDIDHCYICNYSSNSRDQVIPGAHWNGCPRFDLRKEWSRILKTKWQCTVGSCFGHDLGECSQPAHKPALKKMHSWRRKKQITAAFQSLVPEMKQQVRAYLNTRPSGFLALKKFIDAIPL